MLISTVSPVYFWLVVLIACLIIEAVTTQLVTLRFELGGTVWNLPCPVVRAFVVASSVAAQGSAPAAG